MEERNPTQEELNKIQENLSPMDFDLFLEEMKAMHRLEIEKNFLDVPVNDPRWYSLE